MTSENLVELFFHSTPCAICTNESYIAAVNPVTSKSVAKDKVGRFLFEAMEPEDILKYQAHYESKKCGGLFSFPLSDFCSYRHATAVFERFMGKRFVAVLFFESPEPPSYDFVRELILEKKSPCTTDQKRAFVDILIDTPAEFSQRCIGDELMDIKGFLSYTLTRLCEEGLVPHISLSQSLEMERCHFFPSPISSKSFIQIIWLMGLFAENASRGEQINAKLFKYGEDCEIRLIFSPSELLYPVSTVKELAVAFPHCRELLELLDYVSRAAGSSLCVLSDTEHNRLALILNIDEYVHEALDFKSRDHLQSFEEDLAFLKKHLLSYLSPL